MLKLIAAVAANGGLGKNGRLLFSIPEDLRRFKALTLGHTLIMGRSTLDSLPGRRPLPGRRNLVLTRKADFEREGAEVFHGIPDLLSALRPEEEAWVIGGAEVYAQLLPLCCRLYLTEVDAAPEADCFFPKIGQEWRPLEATERRETEGLRYRFCVYERKP